MQKNIIIDIFAKRLTNLINERQTDISWLIEQLGIRSKSTLYRYMNGEAYHDKDTNKFIKITNIFKIFD